MNLIYSDICQKILGEYSEKNKYHSQLLYLLCYIGNVRKVTDIDKIVTVLKRLREEASFKDDIIYYKFCAESNTKLEYGEDFNIRSELYCYGINFDEQTMDINFHLGFRKHKRMLKDLYKLCLAYYVVIGEKDETFKKVGSQNQQKFEEVRKLPKARKTGACMEMQIRENIYSCIRNRIIRFETKMNDQSGNSTN